MFALFNIKILQFVEDNAVKIWISLKSNPKFWFYSHVEIFYLNFLFS